MTTDYASIESALDAVAAPLLVCREEHIVFANRAAQHLTGHSQSQLQTMSLATLLPSYTSNGAAETRIESRLLTADGRRLQVEIQAAAIDYASHPALLLTLHDVTALRQTEARYRMIAETMIDVVVVTNGKGRVVSISPAVKDMLGYSMDELLDTNSVELVHPDDLNRVATATAQLMAEKKPVRLEMRLRHKNGDYVWVESLAGLVQERTGEAIRNISLVRDIHQRKQAEEQLRRSAEQLRLITDHMSDVVSHITPEGIIAYTSPSCYANFGYRPEELVGKMGFECVHPDDLAETAAKFQSAIQTHKTEITEIRYRHKDGHYVWIENSAGVVYDADGQIASLIAISRDITRRKQTEEQLGHSQHLLQQITQMVPLEVYIYDLNQRKDVYHNQTYNLGYKLDEVESSEDFYADLVHPDDRPQHAEKGRRLMQAKDGEIIESEERMLHASGEYRCYYFRDIVFARNPDGTPRQFLGSMLDITARKQAEAQLRKSEEQYRLLANNSTDMIIQLSGEGIIQYVTPSSSVTLGYTPEELIGQTPFHLIHPEDHDFVLDKFQGVMSGLDPYFIEFRALHKQGHSIWLELNTRVIYKAPGVIDHMILAMRDVTARKEAEERLRKSEEQYRLLADSSTDMIGLHELDGTCVYASPSITSQTGWSVQEIVGSSPQNLIHPLDAERVFQQLAEAFQNGQDATVEYRFRCKDEGYIWVESLNHLTFNAGGIPHRIVVTTRNITARKQAEMALKENEERLRLIADNMSDVIVQISPNGLVRYVSPSSRDVLGYEPHELINEPTLIRIHPEDQPLVAMKFQSAYVNRKAETMEARYHHKSGEYLWMELSGMVVLADDGRVRGLVASVRNIEARKQASEALRLSEERLRLITDNIHDLVSMTDGNLLYRYTSPSFRDILGYEQGELIGQSIFAMVHPDDHATVMQKAMVAIERRGSDTVDCRFMHKDGYYIWIEVNGSVIVGEDNTFTGAVFTARDISERRWMQRAQVEQERLQIALQKQQELNLLKNRMMSRLSHELRTPLAIISTSSDLLEHYAARMTEEQRQERLQQIRHQIKHFVGLLDNMSLVVKGSNYYGDFAPTPYDLATLCRVVVDEVKDTLHATHTVELNLVGDLHSVNSDEKLMRLILTHLISNAYKFSPGQSTITLHILVNDEAILLTLSDEGIGIPADDRGHVFDPFFRASNVEEAPGLGIGLSIVKDAVISVRGKIDVKSEVGQGTRVTVEIPLSVEALRAELS